MNYNYNILRLNFSEVIDDGYSKDGHFYTITIEKNNHSQTKKIYQK